MLIVADEGGQPWHAGEQPYPLRLFEPLLSLSARKRGRLMGEIAVLHYLLPLQALCICSRHGPSQTAQSSHNVSPVAAVLLAPMLDQRVGQLAPNGLHSTLSLLRTEEVYTRVHSLC